MTTSLLIEAFLQCVVPGLLYGVGAMGLAISLRYLRFPDLTSIGAVVLGGTVCIEVTNRSSAALGIGSGFAAGFILGMLTGWITTRFKIDPVLASVVTFTLSATPAYLTTESGRISLSADSLSPFAAVFVAKDVALVLAVVVLLAALIAVGSRTSFGLLLLAMSANDDFLKARHRFRNTVFVLTLAFADGLVGLAGALFALRTRSAAVESHRFFLPAALAAIYGGDAIVSVMLRRWPWLSTLASTSGSGDTETTTSAQSPIPLFWRFSSYAFTAVLVLFVGHIFEARLPERISPALAVNDAFQYAATAIAMLAFLAWARERR